MSEISNYEVYKKKLQGICDEHNLVFSFKKTTYPVTLTIKPAGIENGQLALPGLEEKEEISPDAFLMFEFKDGAINYKTSKEFVISETLFNKIKNLFKNMHSCWLQHFFRNIIERELLSPSVMPEIDEDDADDTDFACLNEAEMFEEEIEIPDEDIAEATRIVRMENKASVFLLQRRMNINAEKAEQIMIALETLGIVGPYSEYEPREVLPFDEPADDTEDGADNE